MQPCKPIQWRAAGPYTPNNASKTGLLDETRLYLQTYARLGTTDQAHDHLISGALPQRSRVTRQTIVEVIERRLIRWNPPPWVLTDLATFAVNPLSDAFLSALLLHATRQDLLLYHVVQRMIVPKWREGERDVTRADVQKVMDDALLCHPEIDRWSTKTRAKLAGNLLSILRDYGLLTGKASKQIVEPVVPTSVVRHLTQLLTEEGISPAALPHHADWQLFLWDSDRVSDEIRRSEREWTPTLKND